MNRNSRAYWREDPDCRMGTIYLTMEGVACTRAQRLPNPGSLKLEKATVQYSQCPDDDLTLIRRVAARDREAFETLYYRYAPRVYRYLSSLIRQREIIEEALNDVMVVVWERASRFNATSQLSTWILGIAHYKALKARTRTGRPDADFEGANPDRVETSGPEDTVARRELAGVVAQALDSLPAEQRAVVELAFYHDLPYAEIAQIIGCPENTVKTRMMHARQRLALLFADHSIKELRGLDNVKAE